ncbi:hypothetical protein ACIBCD_41745 [Nocardia brasiliensis]|uniref:hypothetical protein n=1 Tax=Nocardia brasiliensis TaxID=37326 RepID=UPI0037BCCFBC
MARVVCVHGIGQQIFGDEIVVKDWLPALNSGLGLAGAVKLTGTDVAAGFYGDLYRSQIPQVELDDLHDRLPRMVQAAEGRRGGAVVVILQCPDRPAVGPGGVG